MPIRHESKNPHDDESRDNANEYESREVEPREVEPNEGGRCSPPKRSDDLGDVERAWRILDGFLDKRVGANNELPLSPGARPKRNQGQSMSEYTKMLKELAARGVEQLEIEFRCDHAVAVIDGVRVLLTSGEGELFDFLSSGEVDADGFVKWKPTAVVLEQLNLRLKKSLDVHALDERVRQLRKTLDLAGFNKYLVQTHSVLGKRFAWRRRSTPVGNGGEHGPTVA